MNTLTHLVAQRKSNSGSFIKTSEPSNYHKTLITFTCKYSMMQLAELYWFPSTIKHDDRITQTTNSINSKRL